MIKLIYGAKGSGKTGKIVDIANQDVETCDGELVFLTDTEKYLHRLNYNIRLINVTEYDICSALGLIGFIRGIIAGNHDISCIYIDGVHRMTNLSIAELKDFFSGLKKHSSKHGVNIVCTVSTDKLPDFMSEFESEKA